MTIRTALVAAALLAGCSSGSPGATGTTGTGTGTVRYVLQMFLCTRLSLGRCHGTTTAAETAALRDRLGHDPAVRAARYLSDQQVYQLLRRTQPSNVASLVKPDDLPASFLVAAAPASVAAVRARYATAAGVQSIQACRGRCTDSALRALGVLH